MKKKNDATRTHIRVRVLNMKREQWGWYYRDRVLIITDVTVTCEGFRLVTKTTKVKEE